MSDRNALVVLISIATIPLGLWSLFVGLALTVLGGFVSLGAVVQGLVALVVGMGMFVVGFGVFSGEEWAGKYGVVVFGLDFARRVLTFATGDVTFFYVSAFFTLVSGGSPAYLALNIDNFGSQSSGVGSVRSD